MVSSSHENQVGSGRCRSVLREKSTTERKERKGKERKKERNEKKEWKESEEERGEDRLLPPSFFGVQWTKDQALFTLQEVGVSSTLVHFHLRAINDHIVQSPPWG